MYNLLQNTRCRRVATIFSILAQCVVLYARFLISNGSENSGFIEITGPHIHWNDAPPNSASYNISKCIPRIPEAYTGLIGKIKLSGNCINIYPRFNCTGWFIRLAIENHVNTFYPSPTFNWVGDELIQKDLLVGSIGPCFDKCDPQNWLGDGRNPVSVTLFEQSDFSGI